MLDEKHKEPLIEDLCRFVRIPSRSHARGGEEGPLQRVMAAEMRALGARVRTLDADLVPGFRQHALCCGPDRDYRDRPTVIGELGPEDAPALLVLAHSDTAEIFRPGEWTVDPFSGERRGDRIYGRGASDDKWGLAAMLTIMHALRDSGVPLRRRLIFASTIDEENGVANGTLLLMLAGIRAESALYLDGTEMKISIGNLGGSSLHLCPRDRLDEADWARDTQRLEAVCVEASRKRSPLFERPFYDSNPVRETSVILHKRTHEEPPFFLLAFYTLPGEEKAAHKAYIEGLAAAALGDRRDVYDGSYREPWFEPARIPETAPLVGHLSAAARQVLGHDVSVTTISKQDSFLLSNHAGIPTVSFGPKGLMEGPGAHHEPDEYITVDELWSGCRVAYQAVRRWLEAEA